MLLFTAAAASSTELRKGRDDAPRISRTSRKKADYYRELAG